MINANREISKCFSVSKREDIYRIRREIANLVEDGAFDPREIDELKLAVTELLTNILKHAEGGKGGEINATYRGGSSHDSIKIKAINPTKLTNLSQISEASWESSGSLGIGLEGVKRLLEDVNVKVMEGNFMVEGQKRASKPSPSFLTTGVFSVPKAGFEENGDAYFVKRYSDKALLAVIDSLGHGKTASEVSQEAVSVLEGSFHRDLKEVTGRLHRSLWGSRGCVIALVRLKQGGNLEYMGIGNVRTIVYAGDEVKRLVSKDGFLGGKFRSVKVKNYSFATPLLLAMHTDGISRFRLEGPDLFDQKAANLANYIYKKYKKDSDDATILVAKVR